MSTTPSCQACGAAYQRAVEPAKDEIARLKAENAALRARLDTMRERGDMEHARMSAELDVARVGLAAEQELRARSEMIVLAARRLRTAVETLNGISQAETVLWAALDADDAATKVRDE